jgi:HEAT repeat protein
MMPSRDIEPLFEQALLGDYDDEAAWDAVHELRALGTREVFDRAKALCSSQSSISRARGADILAQIGVTMGTHANAFPEESFSTITTMLNEETDPVVLNSAIVALGHLNNDAAIPAILGFLGHCDSGVRFATAFALGSLFEHPASLGV